MTKNSARDILGNSAVEKPIFFTVVIYLILVALMELVSHYVNIVYGSMGNALIIFVAINHAVWAIKTPLYRILPVVVLVPLFRLLSVVLPVSEWPPQVSYIIITLPLLASIVMTAYYHKITLAELGFQQTGWVPQFWIACSGLPLGFIGFLILRPAPLFEGSGLLMWVANLLIALVCIAFTEELLFRGVILHVFSEINGRFALFVSGLFYGVLHLGARSLFYALFMGLVGCLFSYFVIRTRSIFGVIGANFLLIAGMGLIWHKLLF